MTNQEAIVWINSIKDKYIHGGDDDFDEKRKKSLDMGMKALELISHLIDRPCEACDLRKEKGCCKWSCVFEEAEK